jgi:hypothetical protein
MASSGEKGTDTTTEAVHDMLRNVAECISGELEGQTGLFALITDAHISPYPFCISVSSMDYLLLEKMNLTAADKYRQMAAHAESLVIARDKMNKKCADLYV